MVKQREAKEADWETRFGRRRWLRSVLAGGVISALGGAGAIVRTQGYGVDAATTGRLRVLSAWQYAVVRDVARRIVAPDRAEGVPLADDVGVAEFVDDYLVDMRPALRRDFLRSL